MKRLIYLFSTSGVPKEDFNAVYEGVREFLNSLTMKYIVKKFPNWYLCNEPYGSADWYIENSLIGEKVNGASVLDKLEKEPWKKLSSYIDILITNRDIYFPGSNFLVGISKGENILISTYRFSRDCIGATLFGREYINSYLDEFFVSDVRKGCLKVMVKHELGHVFNAAEGKIGADFLLGFGYGKLYRNHCPNRCIMRQGSAVPIAWIIEYFDELMRGYDFCNECLKQMWEYERTTNFISSK